MIVQDVVAAAAVVTSFAAVAAVVMHHSFLRLPLLGEVWELNAISNVTTYVELAAGAFSSASRQNQLSAMPWNMWRNFAEGNAESGCDVSHEKGARTMIPKIPDGVSSSRSWLQT